MKKSAFTEKMAVTLYWAEVGALTDQREAEARRMMSVEERRRCDRYRHEPSRRCYVVTRRLVRTTLSEFGRRTPDQWEFGADSQGRPYLNNPTTELEEMDFNIAHSTRRVVLAVSFGGRVGVDLEPVARRVDHDLVADKFFHEDEKRALKGLDDAARRRRFLQLWVLKEAWMKADGRGMGAGLSEVVFDFGAAGRPQLVALPDGDVGRWEVTLGVDDDHLVAVAYAEGGKTQASR